MAYKTRAVPASTGLTGDPGEMLRSQADDSRAMSH